MAKRKRAMAVRTLESLQYWNTKPVIVFNQTDEAFCQIVQLTWGEDCYAEWHTKEYGNYPCDGLIIYSRGHNAQAFFPSDNEAEGRKLCYAQALKNLAGAYVGGMTKKSQI